MVCKQDKNQSPQTVLLPRTGGPTPRTHDSAGLGCLHFQVMLLLHHPLKTTVLTPVKFKASAVLHP